MFGGHGVFHEGRMFGLIAGGRLYLKADAQTAGLFEARDCRLRYQRQGKTARISYFEAPPELFEDRRKRRLGPAGRGRRCCARARRRGG